MRAKLKQAILYIERNSETVKSITSFPYIVRSLRCGNGMRRSKHQTLTIFGVLLRQLANLHLRDWLKRNDSLKTCLLQ